MPLIECPDCHKKVSDIAPSCPGCGRPMKATTIEQTGKEIKAGQLGGCLISLFGIGAIIQGSSIDPAGYLILAGILIWISFWLRGWWEHG